jgi:hypothetical protein
MTTTTGHGEKLTRLREQAIAALLETSTIAAAAKRTGVDESTLRAWLKDPDFAAAYRDARRDIVARATDGLAGSFTTAVENLTDIMTRSRNDAARIAAAKTVISLTLRAIELDDYDARLEHLEELLGVDR